MATLPCQVCSDAASGYHYGVNSCEGCKGFFRRSIQQKISYKACCKPQKCGIIKSTRNRCQSCRLEKCLAVGMSRDAVRFGRVPKREKVKMEEEIQRASVQSQLDALTADLEDEFAVVRQLEVGFTALGHHLRAQLGEEKGGEGSAASRYVQMMKGVVGFAKHLRGFHLLDAKRQREMLKSAIFPILLLRWTSLLRPERSEASADQSPSLVDASLVPQYMMVYRQRAAPNYYSSSASYQREHSDISAELHTAVVEFIQRFRLLGMDDCQLAIFAALTLCQSDNGIGTATSFGQQAAFDKRLQEKLWCCFRAVLQPMNQITCQILNESFIDAFSTLRTLNSMHQKLLRSMVAIGGGGDGAGGDEGGDYLKREVSAIDSGSEEKKRSPARVNKQRRAEKRKGKAKGVVELGEHPHLRHMLEQPVVHPAPAPAPSHLPVPLPPLPPIPPLPLCLAMNNDQKAALPPPPTISLRESHLSVASLLEAPSRIINCPAIGTQVGEGEAEEEQPLNLCIREMHHAK